MSDISRQSSAISPAYIETTFSDLLKNAGQASPVCSRDVVLEDHRQAASASSGPSNRANNEHLLGDHDDRFPLYPSSCSSALVMAPPARLARRYASRA